jgi:hypothetical protein
MDGMFKTQVDARRFFVDKVVQRAVVEGAPLSEDERQMLFWSETEPDSIADPRWLLVTLPSHPRTADEAIRAFVRMVEALPPFARRCWREASSRTFDIGIQAGLSPSPFEDVRLQPKTLQAVSRVVGTILVTVYAPSKEG